MKKGQQFTRQLVAAAAMLSLSVPLVLLANSAGGKPTLSFEGVEVEMLSNGKARLEVAVYVEGVEKSDGARFKLDYNSEYLTPCDQNDQPITPEEQGGIVQTDEMFTYSPDLYQVLENGVLVPKDPFIPMDKNEVDTSNSRITLHLFIDRTLAQVEGSVGLDATRVANNTLYSTFDSTSTGRGKVALGNISFLVEPEKLTEMKEKYGAIKDDTDPDGTDRSYLLHFSTAATSAGNGPWGIGACIGAGRGTEHYELDEKIESSIATPAQATFTFDFPRVITSVVAAEAELTLDAFRAYTDGTSADVPAALQKYSPTVIASYSDGTKESFIIPWDGCKVYGLDGETEIAAYDPTGGEYIVRQDFKYTVPAAGGTTKEETFPVPVEVKYTVTPIQLLDVTAEGLHKTYPLNDSLVEGNDAVQSLGEMGLPEEARLVTDVPAGGASLVMPIPGWSPKNGAWPDTANGQGMSTLLKDGNTDPAVHHWPTPADKGKWTAAENLTDGTPSTVADNRKGTYTFDLAATYGGAPTPFTKADIQAVYPWLTVPGAEYELTADRTLVAGGEHKRESEYQVTYYQTQTKNDAADKLAELTLEVRRRNSADLLVTSQFRLRLPDGTEVGNGHPSDGSTTNWFDSATKSSYQENHSAKDEYGSTNGYQIVTSPGINAAADPYAQQRERLRRYINLGGWFGVAVNEDPATYAWTDFIPVYVPPRDNLHTASKVYNFIGPNAGLWPWPGGVNNTLILPAGEYEPVDAAGKPQFELDGVTRITQRYGVPTTYDGATGAEPGELDRFTVDPAWTVPAPTESIVGLGTVRRYGPNTFQNGGNAYGAYGEVKNPSSHKATLRTQDKTNPAVEEKITLTCDATSGITVGGDKNVDKVIYTTRQVGYTTRQDYVLTITNVGDTDIYGLDIDTLTDKAAGGYGDSGGHYVILKPPASFLPKGASTTFTLTYVYDLSAVGSTEPYLDKLYITSNSKPRTPGTEGTDYLLDFDAQFEVTDSKLHRVTVKTVPADGTLGTGKVVVGGPVGGFNTTAGSNAFAKDAAVYLMATPTDEYAVKSITAVDGEGKTVPISNHPIKALVGEEKAYTFKMPDFDVTVTVEFYEPVSSKLRLSDLNVYAVKADDAADAADKLKPTVSTPPAYTVWQKSFTEDELKGISGMNDEQAGHYLMTRGVASKPGITDVYATPPEETVDQYLVVLPYEANCAQVETILRHVIHDLGGTNPNIAVTISMEHYDADGNSDGPLSLRTDSTGPTTIATVNTADDTPVYTTPFLSPDPGTSNYVRIALAGQEEAKTITRYYFLELHRRPEKAQAVFNYGNSPYGMILNDPGIDGKTEDDQGKTAKDRALDAFVANRYSFGGLSASLVPQVVTQEMKDLHYWSEAWVDVHIPYEPETKTGLYDPDTGKGYRDADNLDRSPTAFFVVNGEAFTDPGLFKAYDSSGREVDLKAYPATLSLEEAYILDDAATTQTGRFTLPDGATDAAGLTARTVRFPKLGQEKTDIAAGWNQIDGVPQLIRPGRYQLSYTYRDYDYTNDDPHTLTVTRDLVILAPVGDVDADLTRGKPDAVLIKGRMELGKALGYEADRYDGASIYKYRVCDANNDRNINNIDANTISAGKCAPAFYLPKGYKPAAGS